MGARGTRVTRQLRAAWPCSLLALLRASRAALAACGDSGGSGSAASPEPLGLARTLNVMVFNIEVGGTLVSFAKVAEAIKASGADVVGIEEAQGQHTPPCPPLLGWPYYSYALPGRIEAPAHRSASRSRPLPVRRDPAGQGRRDHERAPAVRSSYGPYWVRDGVAAAKVIALENKVRLPAIQTRLGGAAVAAGSPEFRPF